jgi:hypothetical protein
MPEPGLESSDLETLYRRANDGDSVAQCDLAIQLRSTKQPENERASVEWLKRAAEQGDPRAQFTLGLQQYWGIGTAIDLESALVSMTMASLGGFQDAVPALAQLAELPDANWSAVFDRVRWANLTFVMGPLIDGHLEGLTTYRQHEDGTDDAVWFRYETETAEMLFKKTVPGSILDEAFGYPVTAKEVFVGRAVIENQTLAAVTISLRDIVASNGNPVCFRPSNKALDLVTELIGLMTARKWVQWRYTSF